MTFAAVLALTLIVLDHRYQRLEPLRTALALTTYPVQLLAAQPDDFVRSVKERAINRAELFANNAQLRRENLLLKARLQQFESLNAENTRLRNLLGSSRNLGERVMIAEIVAVDLAPFRQQVVVNKGTDSGVFVGQPVLDAQAVMGQVIQATPMTATVLLITDADHALPVEVNRNGLRTIAAGTGLTQQLELLYIPKNADIRVNDLLVSSGLDGRFPTGYPVARVRAVRQDPANPFTTVIAEPTARLDRSREVLLVWTPEGRPAASENALPAMPATNTATAPAKLASPGTSLTERPATPAAEDQE